MTNLSRFIAQKRRAKGLKQDNLAALIGCSRSQISFIESGRMKIPDYQLLRALAKALDIPYFQLLVEAGILQNGDLDDIEIESLKGASEV